MSTKKLIVWDLFGGGQNSVYNALKNNNKFEIYTFDVTEPTREKHFEIDLAQPKICVVLKNLQKQKNIPNPDIIVASPLCQSFSSILSMKGGGTSCWKMNNNKNILEMRSEEEFEKLKGGFTRFLKYKNQKFIAKLGKRCIDNTIRLIKFYTPKFWYIENPKTSLMWKYITLNKKSDFYDSKKIFQNITSYGKYGYQVRKDTIFLSNVKMELLFGKIVAPYHLELEEVTEKEALKFPNRRKMYTKKDDKWYKKWYVQNNHTLNDGSKYATLYPKDAGIGKMQKIDTHVQKNKITNKQICEAGYVSHIPPKLICAIFKHFEA